VNDRDGDEYAGTLTLHVRRGDPAPGQVNEFARQGLTRFGGTPGQTLSDRMENPNFEWGHAWLELRTAKGVAMTFGSFQKEGLVTNKELTPTKENPHGYRSDTERTVELTVDQEQKLIDYYQAKTRELEKAQDVDGNLDHDKRDEWSFKNNCAAFAAGAWNEVTGEDLSHQYPGGISHPSKLADSIEKENRDQPTATFKQEVTHKLHRDSKPHPVEKDLERSR